MVPIKYLKWWAWLGYTITFLCYSLGVLTLIMQDNLVGPIFLFILGGINHYVAHKNLINFKVFEYLEKQLEEEEGLD